MTNQAIRLLGSLNQHFLSDHSTPFFRPPLITAYDADQPDDAIAQPLIPQINNGDPKYEIWPPEIHDESPLVSALQFGRKIKLYRRNLAYCKYLHTP